MKKFFRSLPRKTINILIGLFYLVTLVFAVFPPLYFWGSGRRELFLGIPFSIWYWLINYIVLLAIMFAFYGIENVRGEVDPEFDTQIGKESK